MLSYSMVFIKKDIIYEASATDVFLENYEFSKIVGAAA